MTNEELTQTVADLNELVGFLIDRVETLEKKVEQLLPTVS